MDLSRALRVIFDKLAEERGGVGKFPVDDFFLCKIPLNAIFRNENSGQ